MQRLTKKAAFQALIVTFGALAAGCGIPTQRGVDATCDAMLAMAHTMTDTLIAYSAKPSASYASCGYTFVNDAHIKREVPRG